MPGFKDRMKAIKEHFKPPKRTKPDPKGCFEAAGEHIKRPTQTKPESKGCLEAAGEHIKRPTQTKPESKGFVRATAKPFLWMLPCVKRQKDEDDCPGLPEVKISYADEEIPESLASRSYISLTDSESDDDCAAEADLGSRSDSLPQPQVTDAEEASPDTLEVDSLSSLTDSDAGPSSDSVPEPQGRTSDKEGCDQESDLSSAAEENFHLICKAYRKYSKEEKSNLANDIASRKLDLMLEHFLESKKKTCDELMYDVLASPKCNITICLNHFIAKVNKNQIWDSKGLPLPKVKALLGIRTIVRDHSDTRRLKDWLSCHLVTLINVLVSKFHPKKTWTSRKPKMYLVPGEAIDILVILHLRLDLMHNMNSLFNPR